MAQLTRADLDAMPLPDGEPIIGETIRADGWVYKDLPRMSYEYFDKFVAIVGDDNIKWLTMADYGNAKRGQLFISPEGIARIRNHVSGDHP
jgi:hypothetical protein